MNKKSEPSIYVGCRNTQARVLLWDNQMIRITHIPKNADGYPADRPWVKDVLFNTAPCPSPPNTWQISCKDGKVQVFNNKENVQFSEFAPVQIDNNGKYRLSIGTSPEDNIFGWGEWFSSFHRKKSQFTLMNKESPAPLQSRQTYSNIPIFYCSQGYFIRK